MKRKRGSSKRPFSVVPKIVPIATKHDDSKAWNPEQMVAEFLEEIRSGKIKPSRMMILFFEDDETSDRWVPNRWFANLSKSEALALVVLLQHMTIDDWKS